MTFAAQENDRYHDSAGRPVLLVASLVFMGLLVALLMLDTHRAQSSPAAVPVIIPPGPDFAAQPIILQNETATPAAIPLDDAGFDDIQHGELTLTFPAPGLVITPGESGAYQSDSIAVPLDTIDLFLDVGTIWGLSTPGYDNDSVVISLRASADGAAWGDWLDYDHFHFTETGDLYAHLVTFDKNTRFVQFRVVWDGAALSEPIIMRDVRLAFISPQQTPERVLQQMGSMSAGDRLQLPQAAPQPVVSRTAWGCPDGQGSRWTPQYTQVSHFIVHHTATSNTISDWPAHVRSIWQYHAITLNWGDIGYNFLIDPNGVIYEGRAGGNGVIGAHFSCMNSRTMGVALLGTFSTQSPTQNARNALERLMAWKAQQMGINPTGSSFHIPSQLNLMNISGHRDGNSSTQGCPAGTVCPGSVLYGMLPSIRSNVGSLIVATNTPTPTRTPTPTPTPTPTNTPLGYTETSFTYQEFLHSLWAQQTDEPLTIFLAVPQSRTRLDIYVEFNGTTGIVPVIFEWALMWVPIRFDAMTTTEGEPAPPHFTEAVNYHLPHLIAQTFDALIVERYGAGRNIQEIFIRDGRLWMGLIVPP
jgi:hypothetical protein